MRLALGCLKVRLVRQWLDIGFQPRTFRLEVKHKQPHMQSNINASVTSLNTTVFHMFIHSHGHSSFKRPSRSGKFPLCSSMKINLALIRLIALFKLVKMLGLISTRGRYDRTNQHSAEEASVDDEQGAPPKLNKTRLHQRKVFF